MKHSGKLHVSDLGCRNHTGTGTHNASSVCDYLVVAVHIHDQTPHTPHDGLLAMALVLLWYMHSAMLQRT
jgi:hypothetical protein